MVKIEQIIMLIYRVMTIFSSDIILLDFVFTLF